MGYDNLAEQVYDLTENNTNKKENENKIIEVESHNGSIRIKKEKQKGKSTEVFPFKTIEEIKSMINILDKHIEESTTEYNKKRWCRNKMLFIIGINVGIRGSDLCELKWSDFFYDDFVFRDGVSIQPIKTKNTTGKYVNLFFNDNVKNAIKEYIQQYPIENLNDYVFMSRNGKHIDRISIGRMLKGIAKECGLRQNVNSHSLRKTFGYQHWHNSKDKSKTLTMLQYIFGHASLRDTQKYIGIQQEEIAEVFNNFEILY